jgi:uncharacterized protein (TIGR02453 family)
MTQDERFDGFADTRGRFFAELMLHNDRGWFQAHRAEYEEGWLLPMKALLAEVGPRLARGYRRYRVGEPRIFRIHRDVRFSRDKSPYKTYIGGMLPMDFPRGGRSQVEVPTALYFHVSHDEVFAGAGLYGMDPETLARHRKALLDPRRGTELSRIAAALSRAGFEMGARESTKRVPSGVDPAHPLAALLRMKGLIVTTPAIDRRLLVRRELVASLTKQALAAAPLVRWLLRHVV